MLKKYLINTGLVFLSLLVVVAVTEVAIRFSGLEGEENRQSMVFDKSYARIFAESWYHGAKFDDAAKYEDIRGQRITYDKDAGETRVLFIGDSGTQGAGMQIEYTFPARFEELLREHDITGVAAINVGISGTDQVTQLNLLRDKFYKLQPDIVVLQIFMANDITENLLRVQGLSEGSAYEAINRLRSYSALFNFLFLRWQILNSKYHLLVPGTNGESVVSFTVAPIDRDGINLMNQYWGEIATYKKVYSPSLVQAFDAFEDLLKEFRLLSYTHDFQLILTMVPTLSQVQGHFEIMKRPDSFQQLKESGVNIDVHDLDVKRAAREILIICARQQILCLDPSAELHPHGKEVFLPNDDHFNHIGHKILAQLLYDNFDPEERRFRKH